MPGRLNITLSSYSGRKDVVSQYPMVHRGNMVSKTDITWSPAPAAFLVRTQNDISVIFTASGSFTLTHESPVAIQYAVVGGGGGGGAGLSASNIGAGAGGGGGGYRTNIPGNPSGGGNPTGSSLTLAPGTYPVVVGAGGTGALVPSSATSGSPSYIGPAPAPSVSASGGGYGGSYGAPSSNGGPGGCGGGAAYASATAGTGTTNEGYGGGAPNANAPGYGNGGGGGAGGVGVAGGTSKPNFSANNDGGPGVKLYAYGRLYVGGGGGGAFGAPTPDNQYGWGGNYTGGVSGDPNTRGAGYNGVSNLGGGGGGGANDGAPNGQQVSGNGGNGGSGMVMIRIPR